MEREKAIELLDDMIKRAPENQGGLLACCLDFVRPMMQENPVAALGMVEALCIEEDQLQVMLMRSPGARRMIYDLARLGVIVTFAALQATPAGEGGGQ